MLMLVLAFLSIALPVFALLCRFGGLVLGVLLGVLLAPFVFVIALVHDRRKARKSRGR
jgi:hypothetical protein